MKNPSIITLSVGHDRSRRGACWGNRQEFDVAQRITAGVESRLKGVPGLEVVRVPTPLRSGVYFSRVNESSYRDRFGPSFSTLPQKTKYINGLVTTERSHGRPVNFLHVEFHLNAFPGNQIKHNYPKATGSEILLHHMHDHSVNEIAVEALDHFVALIQTKTGHVIKNRGIKQRPDLWFLRRTMGTAWIWELWFIDDPAAMVRYEENPEVFHETIAAVLYQSIK